MRKTAYIMIALAFLLSWGLWAQEAQAQVEIQLGILVDGSSSIDESDFQLIIDALSTTFADPTLIPRDGSIEIVIVQFSGPARVEVSPTVVTDSSIGTITSQINNMQQIRQGNTRLWDGIDLLTDTMTASANFASSRRQVINIATDGEPFDPPGIRFDEGSSLSLQARDRAVSLGIDEIDAEGIGQVTQQQRFRDFLLGLVFPQPGVLFPDSGRMEPGFVMLVEDFADFDGVLREKIETILIIADGGIGQQHVIGLAKRVSRITSVGLNEFEVDFVLTVENLGTRDLTDVQVTDELRATFPSPATFSLVSAPSATGTLSRNGGFNGSGDRNLLLSGSSTLPAGETETIRFTVRVNPRGVSAAQMCNSATATAQGVSGGQISDVSDNGSDPDPNGNGDPTENGENQCTPVELDIDAASIPFDSMTSLSLLALTLAALLIFRMQKRTSVVHR